MKVIEIVKAHLVQNGFDGLYQPDAECACEISDLQPCGDEFGSCKAGYKRDDPSSPGDWLIGPEKPPARDTATIDMFAGQEDGAA